MSRRGDFEEGCKAPADCSNKRLTKFSGRIFKKKELWVIIFIGHGCDVERQDWRRVYRGGVEGTGVPCLSARVKVGYLPADNSSAGDLFTKIRYDYVALARGQVIDHESRATARLLCPYSQKEKLQT